MKAISTDAIRVLVVDDAPESRTALRKALSFDADIEVVGEAGSGEEALHEAEALRPDIVLMDIRMPGVGGIEATRAIIGRCPGTRVVALTAHEDSESVRSMLAAGATGYVVKGASVDEVLATVRAASGGEALLDERVMPVAIEDLRRLLTEERERRQEMERLARTREEFVHVLSHELRSPLTVMAGVLRFFEQRTPKGDVADLVASALQRADRLEHLVEGLELIGEGARPQTVSNASAVLSEVLANLSLRPDRLEVGDEPWPGVPSRHLGRIAHELIENAVRHGRPPIDVQAFRQGTDGVLIVTDRGDAEPDPHLLEAFIQRDMSTTREQGGLGLGLFIARRLCEASGGRLELRRENGRTVAEARFPLRD